jgi:periplasmic protein TonB
MTEAASYQRTRPSPTALTMVILLHTAAIGALAMSKIEVVRNSFNPTKVIDIKELDPPPQVPPEPVKQRRQEPRIDQQRPIVPILDEPAFKLEPLPPQPQITLNRPIEQIAPPPPPPQPQPSRTVEPARARTNLPYYISDQDYPASAIRNEEQGTTRFQLNVDARGRVSQCSIIASSGSAALDNATCRIMKSRAKFSPARDGYGNATTDVVTAGIKWVLPDE